MADYEIWLDLNAADFERSLVRRFVRYGYGWGMENIGAIFVFTWVYDNRGALRR